MRMAGEIQERKIGKSIFFFDMKAGVISWERSFSLRDTKASLFLSIR
jgi:hypothetical protein